MPHRKAPIGIISQALAEAVTQAAAGPFGVKRNSCSRFFEEVFAVTMNARACVSKWIDNDRMRAIGEGLKKRTLTIVQNIIYPWCGIDIRLLLAELTWLMSLG